MDDIHWTPSAETVACLDFIVSSLTTPDETGTSELERLYLTYPRETERDYQVIQRGFKLASSKLKHVYIWFHADCPPDGWCSFHLAISDRPITTAETRRKAKKRFSINLLRERDEWITPTSAASS